MVDIGDLHLGDILTGNNLFWLMTFMGTASILYWRLRNYIACKNKQNMEKIAQDTVKKIVEQVTNDNIVTEMNFNDKLNADALVIKAKLDADAAAIRSDMDKRFNTVNECNKRIEGRLEEHQKDFHALDKKVGEHIVRSEEQTKALDNVISVVNKALGIVSQVTPNVTTDPNHK